MSTHAWPLCRLWQPLTIIICVSSCFSLHRSVLNWLKSYLSSRSFCIKYDTNFSSLYTSSCSVLSRLLFTCTLLLSTLISIICMHTTQLSFLPLFTHLTSTQTLLTTECSSTDVFLMTANLLTLNSSKTDFLLIGLKKQHAKLLLTTLALFLMNISPS